MYLYLNTTSHEKIFLALFNKQGKILAKKNISAIYKHSEKLLSNIIKIVGTGRDLSKLKGIMVVIGPGSFTSLRIGIATANTLAWSLKIPIVGVENSPREIPQSGNSAKGRIISRGKDELDDKTLLDKNFKKILNKHRFKQILPQYGRRPNITSPKNKGR